MSRRRVPEWLKNNNTTEKLTENKIHKSEIPTQDSSEKGMRGNDPDASDNLDKLITSVTISESNESVRVLRSRSNKIDKSLEKEVEPKGSQYPYIEYNGKIEYLIDMIDIASACDEMIKWIDSQESNIIPIGFDMEWSFSFQTGPEKTALMQLCADKNVCFLFHIFHLKKLPAALVALLNHKKVRLHGVNIKNDLRKLQRDFPEVKVEKMINQCVDLGTWCNTVCSTGGRWSLERLVLYICKLRINKDKKVRMSKWHIIPLAEHQKMYAAIDVYISQVIYEELERRQLEKEKNTEEFLQNYGEEALKAVKALGETFI